GLMFFPDKARSYREAFRVLAPGGCYLFSVWDSYDHNRFARISGELGARLFPGDPPNFHGLPFSCHEIDPIKEALIKAGFGSIDIAVIQREKVVTDLARFGRGLIFGSPLVDQIRARGGDAERVAGELAQSLQREFGGVGRLPMQAIVFSGAKPAAGRIS